MIEKGKYARYVNTGTVGKVVEFIEEDGRTYALLDSTDLYYDIDYLEEAEEPIVKKTEIKTDIESDRQSQEALMDSVASGEMSENIGGG
ncbi:MAG: DUF2098 family protein [Candidatus Methanofastidiosia archaeon]